MLGLWSTFAFIFAEVVCYAENLKYVSVKLKLQGFECAEKTMRRCNKSRMEGDRDQQRAGSEWVSLRSQCKELLWQLLAQGHILMSLHKILYNVCTMSAVRCNSDSNTGLRAKGESAKQKMQNQSWGSYIHNEA